MVSGYPDMGALFLVFAILGFVMMMVGFLSQPDRERSSQPMLQSLTYVCPFCGQPFGQGALVCPKCSH